MPKKSAEKLRSLVRKSGIVGRKVERGHKESSRSSTSTGRRRTGGSYSIRIVAASSRSACGELGWIGEVENDQIWDLVKFLQNEQPTGSHQRHDDFKDQFESLENEGHLCASVQKRE
jgi:hypothetical protein